MPVERLSHPSDGTSRKLCALTDFEFRVWSQYKLSANDFGVMAYTPSPLMAENKALDERGPAIRKALARIVGLGLLLVFDHQGDPYLCSPVWQDFQQIRYPRSTHLPLPTGDVLARCSPATRDLFASLRRKVYGNVSEKVQEESGSVSESPAREQARNANADPVADPDQGEREREPASPTSAELIAARFERFWDAYPNKVSKQDASKVFAKLKPDHELLATILDAIARRKASGTWSEQRYIPGPDKWLRGRKWEDEVPGPKRTAGATESVSPAWHAHCPHVPKCLLVTQCEDAWAVERARVLADEPEGAHA